jgi:hypothetical protein
MTSNGNLPDAERALRAAARLHAFLVRRYWDGTGLVGPDMGIRLNYRAGRFVKSSLRALPWRDDLYYNQGQAYWELGNWRLAESTGDPVYAGIALACAERLLERQRDDGSWAYPNPEWRGRVATTEGTWAAVALLEAYRNAGDPRFLGGAVKWWGFLEEQMEFQDVLGGAAINYFADRRGAVVPNCSSLVLHFLGELTAAGETSAAARCASIVRFLAAAQEPSGELPYTVSSPLREARMPHFQCYQYNAFQCLDLVRYHGVTGDGSVLPLIEGLVRFVREGMAPDGHSRYQCGRTYGHVVYHTAAMAATFAAAGLVGIGGYKDVARRAGARLLAEQRDDGSFPHSYGDYRVLRDRRSYPRVQAMIHDHLLVLADVDRLGFGQSAGNPVGLAVSHAGRV